MKIITQYTLVLENVALGLQVWLVVKVSVDLLGLAIATEQTAENAHASHPEQLLRHAGILRTLPLTVPGVTALPSGLGVLANAGSGVDGDRLLDDQTVVDQLADVLARVSVGNLVDLVGVEPDLLFAALHDAGG